MREGVFVPGSGFNVHAGRNGPEAVVELTLPGATILNKGGAKNAVYRKELLDMTLGGGVDEKWIWARVRELYEERVFGTLKQTPARKLA
jgi:hypothetical protein